MPPQNPTTSNDQQTEPMNRRKRPHFQMDKDAVITSLQRQLEIKNEELQKFKVSSFVNYSIPTFLERCHDPIEREWTRGQENPGNGRCATSGRRQFEKRTRVEG
jgi:hypothetical protein